MEENGPVITAPADEMRPTSPSTVRPGPSYQGYETGLSESANALRSLFIRKFIENQSQAIATLPQRRGSVNILV